MINTKETKLQEKAKEFRRAQQAGIFREIALNNGSTGELRREIPPKEVKRIKARRKLAKQSRKRNRY